MTRYDRENPHPDAVLVTNNADAFEEIAELLPEDEQAFRMYRFGRVVTDRPQWGWATVVWLYEDYTGNIEFMQPYARLSEARRVMREDVPEYFEDCARQQAAECRAERRNEEALYGYAIVLD